AAGAVDAERLVGDGGALGRNLDEILLRDLHALADRDRHFLRLARAVAHAAIAVADHHQRREGEVLAALHHLGDAVDVNHLFEEFALEILLSSHRTPPSNTPRPWPARPRPVPRPCRCRCSRRDRTPPWSWPSSPPVPPPLRQLGERPHSTSRGTRLRWSPRPC